MVKLPLQQAYGEVVDVEMKNWNELDALACPVHLVFYFMTVQFFFQILHVGPNFMLHFRTVVSARRKYDKLPRLALQTTSSQCVENC